jgi:hypothetical protein
MSVEPPEDVPSGTSVVPIDALVVALVVVVLVVSAAPDDSEPSGV